MATRKHDFTAAELKAGVMVLASLVLFVVFLAVARGYRPETNEHVFVCFFEDTLGLNRGADVRFGGVRVGRVRTIQSDSERRELIRVEALVDPAIPVNKESLAYVSQTTLTAEKHLEISTGEPNAPLLADGEEIATREGGLLDQAGQLAGSLQDAIKDIQALLGVKEAQRESEDGELDNTVVSIFDDIGEMAEGGKGVVSDVQDAISDYRGDIDQVVERVKEIADQTKDLMAQLNEVAEQSGGDVQVALKKIAPILENVAEVSENLDEIAASLQNTLDNAAALSGDAKGVLTDNRPVIEDALLDLRETVRHLRDFSRTISEEPQAFIRGSDAKGRRTD